MAKQRSLRSRAHRAAGELNEVRRRGVEELDVNTQKQPQKEIPIIKQLAFDYCAATNQAVETLSEAVEILLRDGLAAYGKQEQERELIKRLFFDSVHTVPSQRPKDRLEQLKIEVGQLPDEEQYDVDKARSTAFRHFMEFLFNFVAAAQRAATAEAADTPEVSAEAEAALTDDTSPAATAASSASIEAASPAAEPATESTTGEAAIESNSVPESPVPPPAEVTPPLAPPPAPARRSRALLTRQRHVAVGAAVAAVLIVVLGLGHFVGGWWGSQSAAPVYQVGHIYRETAGEFGSPTFTDPHSPTTTGPRIEPYEQVEVACKVLAPTIPSISPDGYWYRVVRPTRAMRKYTPATNFLNGDPAIGARHHYTDMAVPDCPT